MTYEARHGQGVSTFAARRGTLQLELTQLVDAQDPVKVSRLKIRNTGPLPAKLTIYGYAEWMLGNYRPRTAPNIVPSLDQKTGALLARNPYSLDFSDRVAFFASDSGTTVGHDGSLRISRLRGLGPMAGGRHGRERPVRQG